LLYFTHLRRSPQWVDLYQIWYRGYPRRRNQLCRIFFRLVQGYWFCSGLKFAYSHRNWRSPLTLSELLFRLWCHMIGECWLWDVGELVSCVITSQLIRLYFDAGSVTYQAQSPDESALVLAARDFGFVFKVTLSSTTGFLLSVKVQLMLMVTLMCAHMILLFDNRMTCYWSCLRCLNNLQLYFFCC